MNDSLSSTMQFTTPTDRTIVIVRSFKAPRTRVFEAWTNAEQLQRWFAPHGLTVPECEVDLRVGGKWRVVMQAPDGTQYPSVGEYLEIVPPEKLVYVDHFEDREGPSSRITLIFDETDGVTTVTITTEYASAEDRDAVLKMGVEQGTAQTFEKLEALLA